MEYYIVYDIAQGADAWRGQGPVGAAAAQVLPEGKAVTVVTAEQFTMDWADFGLDLLKADKWSAVKRRRDIAIDSGAQTPHGPVDSYPSARLNIAGAAQAASIAKAAGQSFSVNWTLLDNSVVTLDAEAMIAVGLAVVQHIGAAHDHARDLRGLIEAAADIPTLLAIDIEQGWSA